MADAGGDLGRIIGDSLLKTLEAAEDALDDEIDRLDRMDEDDLEKLRRKRLDQMKKNAAQRKDWLAAGHGEYRELPEEKMFFPEVKKSKRCVVHFARDATFRCKIVDKHLAILAAKHIETKFLRVDAEKAPFLVERLRVMMLPTIVLIKDGRTDHAIIGFDELGGADDFPTETLESLLLSHEVLLESFAS